MTDFTAPSATADAAQRLREGKETILQVWEARARAEVPAARDQDRLALRNSLPLLLEGLLNTLDPGAAGSPGHANVSREHGEQRAGLLAYTPEQVMREYRLLRQVIFEVLERDGGPLSAAARDLLLGGLELGMGQAIGEFSHLRGAAMRDQVQHHLHERDRSRSDVEHLRAEREAREAIVSALTHDLRTPLAAARMGAQLILRHPDDTARHLELAARVVANLDRVDRMVSDLLDASRVRAGEALNLRVEPCDLAHIAREVCDELASIHGDRFVLQREGADLSGHWSARGLERVLENLLTNAVKYGDSRAPITVRLRASPHRVELAVVNQGPALSAAETDALFRPFHRLSRGEALTREGWGMGLAVVRGVVEALGGGVRVTSDAEHGTAFTIDLPRDARPYQGRGDAEDGAH